jgi:hypothetical protein
MSRNGPSLNDALKDFVFSHPDGWGHTEWEQFLDALRRNALEVRDEVAIGAALERERLLATLERITVKGLGPKRRAALADRFGRLWDLQQASADEVARGSGIPRAAAEELLRAVRA